MLPAPRYRADRLNGWRPHSMRRTARILLAVLLILGGYLAVTAVQVVMAARQEARGTADAIVVLGAAQYDGQPSPELRTRLDHAVALYEDGRAKVIWVTGGRGLPDDTFSEASASDLYLQNRGVPAAALRLEVHGENTYESLAAVSREIRDEGRRVLLVSDPWHAYRIAAVARDVGLRPRVSPSSELRWSDHGVRRLTRETIAVAFGRIVGYRRLSGLGARWGPPPI